MNQKTSNSDFDSAQMEDIIRGLYLGMIGREPEPLGLAHWLSLWRAGADVNTIAAGISNSEEYRQGDTVCKNKGREFFRFCKSAVTHARGHFQEQPLTIVDVGAQELLNESHVYSTVACHELPHRIIGFEPLDHRRKERLANGTDASISLLPDFIGDGDQHIFHINDPDSTSSLLPLNQDIIGRFVHLDSLKTIRVESAKTTTLDSALHDVSHIDLLKLDIQGFELPALLHASATLRNTLVIHCEVSFLEIYRGQALFSEIDQYLRDAGFDLVDFGSMCRYPLAKTQFQGSNDWLGWADAIYFKRVADTTLWRDILAQSLMALIIYKKPSLSAGVAKDLKKTPAESYLRVLNTKKSSP